MHVSLNSRETCVGKFHPFFNNLYKFVLNKKNNLSKNPPPFRINYLLYLAHSGWVAIRNDVLDIFKTSKNIGLRTIIELLDNVIPAVLDVYTTLFRNNHFDEYFQTIMRIWMFMSKCGRKNYDKIMLAFIHDVTYWKEKRHSIMKII